MLQSDHLLISRVWFIQSDKDKKKRFHMSPLQLADHVFWNFFEKNMQRVQAGTIRAPNGAPKRLLSDFFRFFPSGNIKRPNVSLWEDRVLPASWAI